MFGRLRRYLRFQVNGKESIANSRYDESRETEPDSRDAENVQDRDLLLGGMPTTILRSFTRHWCRKIHFKNVGQIFRLKTHQ